MALKEFCLSYVEVQHSLLIQVLVLLTHQALKWYHKTLQFIPESMSSLTELEGIQPNSFVAAPVTWQKDVRTYVRKHPRPGEEHLIKLDTDAPVHLDVQTKSDAKTLAQRLRMLFRLMDSTVVTVSLIANICTWKDELRQKGDKRLVIGGKSQSENGVYLAQRETTDTEWSGSVNEVRANRKKINRKKESKALELPGVDGTPAQADTWNPDTKNDERFVCLSCHQSNHEREVPVERKSTSTADGSELSDDDYIMEYIKSVTNCKIPNRYKTAQIKDFVSTFPAGEGRKMVYYPQPDIHRGSSVTWMSVPSRDDQSTDSSINNEYDSDSDSPRQTVKNLRKKLSKSMRNILEVEMYKIKGVDNFIKGNVVSKPREHSYTQPSGVNRNMHSINSPDEASMSSGNDHIGSDSRSESESDTGTSEFSTLDQDAQRLLLCRESRLQEESELKEEWNRYGDILNQAEALYQQNMGTSLRRAEALLKEIDEDNVPITEQLSFEDLSDGEISELENFYSEQLPELGVTSNPSNRTGGASSKSYKSTSTDLGYDSFNERVPRKWEHSHSVV
ncbi:hypothetical protein ScPMuIL_015680 [Solemya velum]